MVKPRTSDRKKVLVIDDEPGIVAYLTTVLEDEGFDSCSAVDAHEGLAAAREQMPDLITLDVMMPKKSGIAMYQELKLDSDLREIPVIFISAFGRNNDFRPESFRKMLPDENIPVPDAHLEKPIDVANFVATVNSLVGTAGSPTVVGGGKSQ
jgi:CheY-like chemotaxis protein